MTASRFTRSTFMFICLESNICYIDLHHTVYATLLR